MLHPSSGICFLKGRVGYLLFIFTKMWARPWCLLVIIWTVFAQPCGRASKTFTLKKSSCSSFLEDWYFLILLNISSLLYYVCTSHFAHAEVKRTACRSEGFVFFFLPWGFHVLNSGLVASAFIHWVISLAQFLILLFHVCEDFASMYMYGLCGCVVSLDIKRRC